MRRSRWLIAPALAFLLLVIMLPASISAAGPSVERPLTGTCGIEAHWSTPYACDLLAHKIMQGDSAGFRLDDSVTRAEFVTLLIRAFALEPQAGASYRDVAKHWSLGYVNAAVAAGIVEAPTATSWFRPDDEITRQDAVTMLARAFGGIPAPDADMAVLSGYKDASRLSFPERDAFVFGLVHGVIQGRPDKTLDPVGLLTRGEAAKIISAAVPELLPSAQSKVTLLLYNDLHGHLQQDAKQRAGMDLGVERLATAILGQELKNPATLVIDGGDTFQGAPISNLVDGQSTEEWRNLVGVDLAALGNHEFDWKLETMTGLMTQTGGKVLAANIFNAGKDSRPDWAVPTAMVKVGGLTVGAIGITTPVTKGIVLPDHVAGLDFRDPAAVVNTEAKNLRAAGADLVIVVAHAQVSPGRADSLQAIGEVAEFMKNVNEPVDAITGGHSHEQAAGYVLDATGRQVPVIQAGSYGQTLAKIDLYVDQATKSVVRAVPYVWQPSQTLAPAPAATGMMYRWTARVKPIESRSLGRLPMPLSRKTTPAGESALGDFIADGMLTAAPGIQIALMNGGGVRADIESNAQGEVTWGQWFTVQPFGNTVVTVDMTGEELRQTLEQAVESYVKQLTKQPGGHNPMQVAGIKFAYDWAKPFGQRIDPADLKLANGQPVEPTTTYKVAVNNFMAAGGDDLKVLGSLKAKQMDIGAIDLDVTVNWFQKIPATQWEQYKAQDRIAVRNFPQ